MTLRRSERVFKSNGMKLFWAIVILGVLTAGCAAPEKTLSSNDIISTESLANDDFDLLEEELTTELIEISDPLEPLNRVMYHVNDGLYFWVLKPVTEVYTNITPKPAKTGIRNFFGNLTTPVRFVSCHLQGKTTVADVELNRFLINTTAGILGFGDPSKDQHGLEPPAKEDLGQTLATYGLGDGFYIVWPLLGPSTLRDSAGKLGGVFLNPIYYVEPAEIAIGISTTGFINENSFHIGEYENLKSDAIDSYITIREVYIQYRRKQIKE